MNELLPKWSRPQKKGSLSRNLKDSEALGGCRGEKLVASGDRCVRPAMGPAQGSPEQKEDLCDQGTKNRR